MYPWTSCHDLRSLFAFASLKCETAKVNSNTDETGNIILQSCAYPLWIRRQGRAKSCNRVRSGRSAKVCVIRCFSSRQLCHSALFLPTLFCRSQISAETSWSVQPFPLRPSTRPIAHRRSAHSVASTANHTPLCSADNWSQSCSAPSCSVKSWSVGLPCRFCCVYVFYVTLTACILALEVAARFLNV